MLSAGHLGFDGLLGFLPGFFPGFLPLPGFLAASATTRSSSSKTTRWCHRMMYCGALGLRWLAWLLARLFTRLFAFARLLGGLSDHQ